jgi:hypothetical protein
MPGHAQAPHPARRPARPRPGSFPDPHPAGGSARAAGRRAGSRGRFGLPGGCHPRHAPLAAAGRARRAERAAFRCGAGPLGAGDGTGRCRCDARGPAAGGAPRLRPRRGDGGEGRTAPPRPCGGAGGEVPVADDLPGRSAGAGRAAALGPSRGAGAGRACRHGALCPRLGGGNREAGRAAIVHDCGHFLSRATRLYTTEHVLKA